MSLDATRWAWTQRVKPASLKLTLLSLADRADGVGFECFPGIDLISADTGLDRKTVIAGIQKLCDIGLLSKVHRPNKSTIYRLIGVPDRNGDEVFHVIYRTTDPETGEYYIGAHTTAKLTDRYKGSGRWVTLHENKPRLKVEILERMVSRKAALEREIALIESSLSDHLCRNLRAEVGNLSQAIAKSGSSENGTPEISGSTENGTLEIPKTVLPGVPKTGHEPIIEPTKNRSPSKPAAKTATANVSFDRFWAAYPRKQAKAEAMKVWKARGLDAIADLIVADVTRRRIDDQQWSDPQYIPYPATYINQRRWEDEITAVSKPAPAERLRLADILAESDRHAQH